MSHQSAMKAQPPLPPPPPSEGEPVAPCVIIEGLFAYVIQLLLAVIAIAALVIKRYWNTTTRISTYPFLRIRPPSRPFNIWILDVLKQCTGHVMAHIINIVLAVMLARVGGWLVGWARDALLSWDGCHAAPTCKSAVAFVATSRALTPCVSLGAAVVHDCSPSACRSHVYSRGRPRNDQP